MRKFWAAASVSVVLAAAIFVIADIATDPTADILESKPPYTSVTSDRNSPYSRGPRPHLGSEVDGVKVLPEDFERYILHFARV